MKATLSRTLGALALGIVSFAAVGSASAQVRISQVYGAGGLSATQPNADYVELYNDSASPVDISGWSVQATNVTASTFLTTGMFWTSIVIPSGVVPPHGYFLIQANSPASAVGTPLPTPDLISDNMDDLIINPTGSIVVLENSPFTLPSFYCPVGIDSSRIDSVTWGGALPCAEGGVVGPATSGSAPFQAIFRRGGGCYDTENNATDLIAGPPTPHNSASPANAASYLTPSVTPATTNAGTSATFTVTFQTCTDATPPTLTAVRGDFTALGGGAAVDFSGGPTIWTSTLTVPAGQTPGTYTVNITGYAGATTFPVQATLNVLNPLPPNDQCGGATVISSLPFAVNLNVAGATNDTPAPGTCIPTSQTQGLYGVWYTFTAPTNGTLLWTRDTASTLFTYSGIWVNAGCGSITQSSAICATGNDWGVQLSAGDTALVQISLKSGSTPPTANLSGTFSFVTTPPPNDNCASATNVAGQLDTPVSLTNVYAVKDIVAIDGSNTNCIPEVGNQGAWYKFPVTQPGVLAMTYTPGTASSGQGIKWAVWARPSTESGAAACAAISASTNPDYCSAFSVLNIVATPGMTYYMMVYNGNNGSGFIGVSPVGPLSLNFHFEPGTTPANDLCVNAMDLSTTTLAPLTVTVDNFLATMTGEDWISGLSTLPCAPVTSSSTFISGVWFKYVATQNGVWRERNLGSQNAAIVIWEVPTGTPNPCALFNVNNLIICSRSGYNSVNIRAGKTYYMYQYRNNTGGLTAPLTLQNTFYPASQVAPNDTCDTATDIAPILGVPQIVDQYTAGHDIAYGCATAPDRSTSGVWYKYTPAQDTVVVMTEDSLQDAGISLWDGGTSPPPDCNAMTVDPTLATGKIQQTGLGTPMYCMASDRMFYKALAGHTYYMLVTCQFISAFPTYPYNITFRTLPVVSNEDCATATTLVGTGTFDLHNVVDWNGGVPAVQPPDSNFMVLNCPSTASVVTNDTWYRWVAPATGPASFQVRAYPKPMAGGKLAFYTAGPGNSCPTSIAANLIKCLPFGTPYPDSGAVTFTPTAGQVYYIQFCSIQGTSTEPFGWVVLDINQSAAASGRCCIGSACTLTSSVDCASRAGVYGGDGSLCSTPTATNHTYSGSGGAIPDGTSTDLNSPGVLTSTINVPDNFSVADVEVNLSITHAKYGDLRITLSKGSTFLVLSDRGRRGFTPADAATKTLVGPGSYRFSDAGAQSWFDLGNSAGSSIPNGTYKPAAASGVSDGLRKRFNGQNSAGAWTLTIADEFTANTGTLSAWTLTLKQGVAASCALPGVCCRGATCNTTVTQANCTVGAGSAGAHFVSNATTCNSGSTSTPCCWADYNKANGLSVQDIFDYLNDWFAGRPFALVGGNGSGGTLTVQNIFDFLNAWFAGC